MKKSFRKIIEESFQNKSDWNYYAKAVFDKNPMLKIADANYFLKKFIDLSGKADSILVDNIGKLRDRERHVVSAFFIGHYIYKNSILKDLIDKEIEDLKLNTGVKSHVNFSFIWFMTCLFHDLGYNYEGKSKPDFQNFDSLTQVTKELPKINGLPKLYADVYKHYFRFRLEHHNKNDHGIVGAHILYRELFEIREKAEKEPKNSQKGLSWECQLLKVYNFIAWNILGHNIWYVKPPDENWSHYEDMQDLKLKDNEYKISVNEHPFFFLFCLVDTIEPYKKVLDYESLKKVSIDIKKDKIIISTSMKCACSQSILKQVKSLNNWLTTTNEVNDKAIKIDFKPKNI